MQLRTRPFLALGALAFAASIGAAQSVNLEAATLTWPGNSASAGTATRAVSGNFTGENTVINQVAAFSSDQTPDVWQQTANALILFMNPSYMDFSIQLSVNASSIARIPAAVTTAADRLVYADAYGLSVVEFTGATANPLTVTSLGFGAGSTPSWANAKSLSCYDLNGDGLQDLVAISSSGSKLMRLINNGAGGYTHATEIYLGPNAFEAIPMVYDTGAPQIAVLTNSWMFVVQQTGVRSKLIATNSAFGHIARVSQVASPPDFFPDCIVWLQEVSPGGAKQVRVIDGRTAEQPVVDLTGIDASAIFAGDINGNGSEDFGLVTTNTMTIYKYLNQRTGTVFDIPRFTTSSTTYNSSIYIGPDYSVPSPLVNNSTPLLVDLNLDRKADIFVVERNVPRAMAIETDRPVEPPVGSSFITVSHPCFDKADWYPDSYYAAVGDGCNAPEALVQGYLKLRVKNPWPLPSPSTGWKMELVLYRQEAATTTTVPGVTSLAVQHYEYDLSGTNYSAGPNLWSFPIRINAGTATTFDHKYYAVVRPIPPPSGSNGLPLTQYVLGTTAAAYSSISTNPMHYLLNSLPGSWGVGIQFDWHELCNTVLLYGLETSGGVPQTRVPPYDGTTPPNRGPVVAPPVLGN